MRILVLGAKGMAGHKLLQILSINHDVTGTVRGNVEGRDLSRRIGGIRVFGNVDADDFESIIHVIKKIRPEVVINGIGVIKQRDIANNALICININSLLPHKLAVLCAEYGFRLIHISTDCVFSGKNKDK